MKRFFPLLLVFLLSAFHASSQTHFITAGQTQGMIFTDYVPDAKMIPAPFDPNHSHASSRTFYLDVNHDSISDLKFYFHKDGGIQIIDEMVFFVQSLDSNVQIACTLDTLNCGETVYAPVIFDSTDTISDSNLWTKTIAYDLLYYWSIGSNNCDKAGSNKQFYYLAGRLISNSDTSLFYIHVNPDYYYGDNRFLDYAIEGPDSTIIIASTNDLPPSKLLVSPNPFSSFINITSEKPFQYTISDYTGRVVMQGVADKIIETEELASGSYILTLKNEEMVAVKKMVKYRN